MARRGLALRDFLSSALLVLGIVVFVIAACLDMVEKLALVIDVSAVVLIYAAIVIHYRYARYSYTTVRRPWTFLISSILAAICYVILLTRAYAAGGYLQAVLLLLAALGVTILNAIMCGVLFNKYNP